MGVRPTPRPAPVPLDLIRVFLNTADLEDGTDDLETAAGVRAWLFEHDLLSRSARIDEDGRRRLIELREVLRELACANNGGPLPKSALERLNRLARSAAIAPVFRGNDEVSLVSYRRDLEGVISALLAVVCQAMRDGTWTRLKACRNANCRWAFYDASRNRSGNWCSMAICGNRAKTRAYRRRMQATMGDQSPV